MTDSANKKEIRVICTEQRPILPDKIGLKLQVSLVEKVDRGTERIPNIMFEVRVGVDNVYKQQSNSHGILELNNIEIPYQNEQSVAVEVKASDDLAEINETVHINIEESLKGLREAGENIRKMKEDLLHSSYAPNKIKAVTELIKYSGYSEVDDIVIDILNDLKPEEVVKLINIFKNSSLARTFLLSFSEKNPELMLINFPEYHEMSWAEDIILRILELRPELVIIHQNKFRYQPWEKSIFKRTIQLNSDFKGTKWNDEWEGYQLDITKLPQEFIVKGELVLPQTIKKMPKNIEAGKSLTIYSCDIDSLPENMIVGEELSLNDMKKLRNFAKNYKIGGDISISNCPRLELPEGIIVNGDLNLDTLIKLPKKLVIKGDLYIEGLQDSYDIPPNIDENIPEDITVERDLVVRLPDNIRSFICLTRGRIWETHTNGYPAIVKGKKPLPEALIYKIKTLKKEGKIRGRIFCKYKDGDCEGNQILRKVDFNEI